MWNRRNGDRHRRCLARSGVKFLIVTVRVQGYRAGANSVKVFAIRGNCRRSFYASRRKTSPFCGARFARSLFKLRTRASRGVVLRAFKRFGVRQAYLAKVVGFTSFLSERAVYHHQVVRYRARQRLPLKIAFPSSPPPRRPVLSPVSRLYFSPLSCFCLFFFSSFFRFFFDERISVRSSRRASRVAEFTARRS